MVMMMSTSETAERQFLSGPVAEAGDSGAGAQQVRRAPPRGRRSRPPVRPAAQGAVEDAAGGTEAAAAAAAPAPAGVVAPAVPASATAAGEPRRQGKRKRHRSRKRESTWKPYSQMTWQEKRELEEKEAKRREIEVPVIPRTKDGRIRRGVRIVDYRPPAPRNTTADIIGHVAEDTSGSADGLTGDGLGPLGTIDAMPAREAGAAAAAAPAGIAGAVGGAPSAAGWMPTAVGPVGSALVPDRRLRSRSSILAPPVPQAPAGGTSLEHSAADLASPEYAALLVSGTGSMAGRVVGPRLGRIVSAAVAPAPTPATAPARAPTAEADEGGRHSVAVGPERVLAMADASTQTDARWGMRDAGVQTW